ncbi:tyrosine-protein kinase Fer-like isoform X2 [Lineus longissimus]|uniref:tyrosine-protein kinase Fer-like isoform X2 n=1 Tax=Lineus longissimus TaxID=88925 RepID=UPI00315D7D63
MSPPTPASNSCDVSYEMHWTRFTMGFGTELQRKESHEALLKLQDAEIRLLENMKQCLNLRIKSDRDYAKALTNVCNCAQKFENSDFNSPIFQAWNLIIKETQNLASIFKSRSDDLAANTMEKVTFLIQEKKGARKIYNDERNRLDFEIYRLQEEMNRNKNEYEKMMDRLRMDQARYEELYRKGKPGNKFDESKTRYLKTTSKLHKIHNEYVISVRDFKIQQTNFLKTILPNLLEFHQKIQETLVRQCKEILGEYVHLTDLTQEDIVKSHKDMAEHVTSVTPSKEYSEFLENHRSDPIEEELVTFDDLLLEDYNGCLCPDEIALNDLTVEQMKQLHTSYEDKIRSCETRMENKERDLQDVEEEIAKLPSELDDAQKADLLVKQKAALILKRELAELECHKEKYKDLYEFIHQPIETLGENIPQGLDLDDMPSDGTKVANHRIKKSETISLNDTQASVSTLRTKLKLKNPFRKTVPTTPTRLPSKEVLEKRESYENGEKEVEKVEGATGESVQSSGIQIQNLEDEEWFHGVLPREEVQRLLKNNGDFLVRESRNRKTGEAQSVLSVFWNGHKHFIIQGGANNWRFEGPSFPTVQELIDHQLKSDLPVTVRSQAILKRAIVRSDWQLKNDEVILGPKIGNGNFGDVCRGTFKGTEVAVKTCKEVLDEDMRKKFLKEGQILKQYDHPNIVKLIGIAAQRQPIMIVMEYVPGGSLLNFLKQQGMKQSAKQLIQMCIDAAAGMAYLESRNCIHRDLAARNCLVGIENVVKIADFGMSREEEIYIVSDGLKQIPIKWTAPEALEYAKYTSKCDVWSYGILMWEVFSLGDTPYRGMTNAQAKLQVLNGYRMPLPAGCPADAYALMLRCWDIKPEKRPHFEEIHTELKSIHRRS